MLRIKASQLSEENNRLRRHMASLASLGDARSSSPPPEVRPTVFSRPE